MCVCVWVTVVNKYSGLHLKKSVNAAWHVQPQRVLNSLLMQQPWQTFVVLNVFETNCRVMSRGKPKTKSGSYNYYEIVCCGFLFFFFFLWIYKQLLDQIKCIILNYKKKKKKKIK